MFESARKLAGGGHAASSAGDRLWPTSSTTDGCAGSSVRERGTLFGGSRRSRRAAALLTLTLGKPHSCDGRAPARIEGAVMGLMGIGEFARLSRLSPKALRLYDELGLLQR